MNAIDLFNLGNQFMNQGKVDMAIDMWLQATQAEPRAPESNLSLYNMFRSQGNLQKARDYLNRFLNSYQTAYTQEVVPKAKAELVALEEQMKQKPQ